MLTIVRLTDGCYRIVVDIETSTFHVHREWTFAELTTSTADVEKVEFSFNLRGRSK